jgi:hypothetical protein
MKNRQLIISASAGWWLCILTGCSSWLPEMVPYGAVTAPDVNRSLNGLGLHREMWEVSGARCLTPQKLSPKLQTVDVIVLIGQTFEPPGAAARSWLEDWLASQAGRTVIYFGRDFNAELEYRRQTLNKLPAEDQGRGAEILALREADEFTQRLHQLSEPTFCDWFFLDTRRTAVDFQSFQGDWVEQAPELNELSGNWSVRVALQPPDALAWQKKYPSWLAKPRSRNPLLPTTPVQSGNDDANTRSQWEPEEFASTEQWDAAVQAAATSEILLAGDDGQPLIFRLTSERYPDSQILIVANGAPLLNGSLVLPLHQRLGEMLIDATLPAERVALLAYDASGLMVSNVAETDNRAAGLEMLTVWPLSGITMPAALLGIITCAALLPILGRPRKQSARSVSDFGLHIEAIGRMLYEARDLPHARSAIGDYYRKVRDEPPPQWLEELDQGDPLHQSSPHQE